jgi:hypothetical protein
LIAISRSRILRVQPPMSPRLSVRSFVRIVGVVSYTSMGAQHEQGDRVFRTPQSVQGLGSECCVPSSSSKKTRSSPHVWRITTNKNSRPHHGWNGCVTRTVRCAPSGSGVGDGSRQCRRRAVGQDGQDRMPRLVVHHRPTAPSAHSPRSQRARGKEARSNGLRRFGRPVQADPSRDLG